MSVLKGVGQRRKAAPRELIDTGTNKLFVRRNSRGTSFSEVVDVSKSLSADRRRKAKAVAKPGYGDRGDRKKAAGKKAAAKKAAPAEGATADSETASEPAADQPAAAEAASQA